MHVLSIEKHSSAGSLYTIEAVVASQPRGFEEVEPEERFLIIYEPGDDKPMIYMYSVTWPYESAWRRISWLAQGTLVVGLTSTKRRAAAQKSKRNTSRQVNLPYSSSTLQNAYIVFALSPCLAPLTSKLFLLWGGFKCSRLLHELPSPPLCFSEFQYFWCPEYHNRRIGEAPAVSLGAACSGCRLSSWSDTAIHKRFVVCN